MAENPPNNNNNGNNGNGQQQFPMLQIQDIDDWLRFNGLRGADDPNAEAPAEYGSFLSALNRSEAHAKHEAQDKYQQEIHASIFKESLEVEEQEKSMKVKLLESWKGEHMEIVAKDHKTFQVPLSPLAAVCDTVFALASSRRYMNNNSEKDESKTDEPNNTPLQPVHLSLEDYQSGSVQEFLDLAIGKKSMGHIKDEHVVDCCHIGHYLQCHSVLEGTEEVLLRNIDSDNCLSLCQMADHLNLPDLFERALFYMLKSLENLESQEAYEAFSPDLKGRIADIRAVFTKHQEGKTTRQPTEAGTFPPVAKKSLYFTSLEEYIAIFAENVQYHKERLEEAKEQNIGPNYSAYAESKIAKQELRVLALEAMLQEQKRMFGTGKHHQNYKRMRL